MSMEDIPDEWEGDYDYTRGRPDGDLKWVHALQTYVRLWRDPHLEEIPKGAPKDTLQYHVPKPFRGKYRANDLPEEYLPGVVWDVDHDGYVLCTGITVQGKKCRRQAQNRSGYCEAHGGALHPMDRVRWVDPSSGIDERHQVNIRQGRDLERVGELSRWQQLIMGIISVEDLDDEELSRGQCRDLKGGFSGRPPRMVPRDLHDQMMAQLLSRAKQKFREGLIDSIEALTSIAKGDAFEPADRIKAAGMVIDRVMGKTPDVILSATTKAPWEEIFTSINRDTDDAAYKRIEEAIDAETVDVDEEPSTTEQAYARRFGPPENPGQVQAPRVVTEPTLDDEPVTPHEPLPPHDPIQRQRYEAERAKKEETSESLRERIAKGRAKRYTARAAGSTTVSQAPYGVEWKTIVAANDEHDGVYRVKFIPPGETKVPKSVTNKEERQRKYDR